MTELLFVALVMAILTLYTSELPEIEVVESAMNDENFTDLVLQTRGELAIDTNIRVLTYDYSIFDDQDRVDRSALALQLGALMEMKPAVVGVDFLVEDERPEAPDGDAMLAALVESYPNLLFGIFYEDSTGRFRTPPSSFPFSKEQLGCINLQPDEDRTIRTYKAEWASANEHFPTLAAQMAGYVDTNAVGNLRSYKAETFVIDYAGGIGEQGEGTQSASHHIFPTLPLSLVFETLMSGDTAQAAYLRSMLHGKAVLVGYADLRTTQVTSIVDRFYTPLKPEDNSLPDMHGVGIHANILNTILQKRVIHSVAGWANVVWGTILVFLMFTMLETLQHVKRPKRRTVLKYAGVALLLIIGVLFPIVMYRYTPYKFSIYTPMAGLLLGRIALEAYDKLKRIIQDARYRRRINRPMPEVLQQGMKQVLAAPTSEERYVQTLHLLQRLFHTCSNVLFAEAKHAEHGTFPLRTIAAPTTANVLAALKPSGNKPTPFSRKGNAALIFINQIHNTPLLRRSLALARSLTIALNEIRRQNATLAIEIDGTEKHDADENLLPTEGAEIDYTDMVLSTLTGAGGDGVDMFHAIYQTLDRVLQETMEELQQTQSPALAQNPWNTTSELSPFIIHRQCRIHKRTEAFIYFAVQEDANNQDDFFDLVYGGETVRCQPEEHPGLGAFKQSVLVQAQAGE